MKCILLCAGYATRLFPLTENFPKALLPIGDKPLLNYIYEEIETIPDIDDVYVITNNKYYEHFLNWQKNLKTKKNVKVINDHTNSNEDRLGAIGDIIYTIELEKINDDLLIIAGDNLFNYKLADVVNFFKKKNKTTLCAKELDDINLLKSFAVALVDKDDKIISLEEKPENPKSNLGVYATYIYPKEVLPYFVKYKSSGLKLDAPGNFPSYLYKYEDVYIYRFSGECYDVGTLETYKLVNELYSKK